MNRMQSAFKGKYRISRISLLASLFSVSATLAMNATAYNLIDLGVDVSPADINNAGAIVGSRKTAAGTVGFHMQAGGAVQDIPDTVAAHAINDAGAVTGTTLTGTFLLDGGRSEWDGYSGYGLNESGQIAGNRQLKNPYRATPLPLDPAIYTPNKWANLGIAGVYPRGTRQGVYADLYVLDDINDLGYAVGSRRRYGLVGSSAILTTPDFKSVTYLSIPNGGAARALNSRNRIVGTTGSNSSAGQYAHAFLYDFESDAYQDLGTLNGGLTSSAADINDNNQVVGSSWLVTQLTSLYNPSDYHAFLWQDDVMSDLNDPGYPGWVLTAATAINDNGDIVGTGLLDGQVHGFLLANGDTPPPPPPNTAPVAVATADVTAGKAPLTVQFSSEGSHDPEGGTISFQWEFGDGDSSQEPNPSHTFTGQGGYVVMLTVTDSTEATATAQVNVSVRKPGGKPQR